jgi:hypothetical protein
MLDFITVVFRDELPLLEIQAESISQYINPEDISAITIVVIDNDDVGNLVDTDWWGINQNKVKIIPYSKWNYTSRINGWENQQLLKLLAASEYTSKWSMVLDAKTWFVQNLDISKLFDTEGRPNMGLCGIFTPFVSSQQFVEKLYNISMSKVIGPSGVPFVFHTETAQGLVDSVDDFIDFFQTSVRYPNLVTEFHLYSGYVLSKFDTYETLYNKTQYYSICNISQWEVDSFDSLFNSILTTKDLLTASIHRKAYPLLSKEQLQKWVDFLRERKLNCNNSIASFC